MHTYPLFKLNFFTSLRLRGCSLLLACWFSTAALAGSFDDYFIAVKKDDAATIVSLLQRGLTPNLVEPQRGDTGLILALREGSEKVFQVLLMAPAVDLNARAYNGNTALMIAVYKGNIAAVKALIAQEAEVNQTGWTALHYAAITGNNDMVQLLLDASAYIDTEAPDGTTPIMMAAQAGHILTVKLLLDEGADVTLKNHAGLDAIDLARAANQRDIVEGLTYRLKNAAKP